MLGLFPVSSCAVLYCASQPNCRYWKIVLIARKLSLALTAILLGYDASLQASVAASVLFISYILQQRLAPFLVDDATRAQLDHANSDAVVTSTLSRNSGLDSGIITVKSGNGPTGSGSVHEEVPMIAPSQRQCVRPAAVTGTGSDCAARSRSGSFRDSRVVRRCAARMPARLPDYNSLESTFLVAAMLILLAGIVFVSDGFAVGSLGYNILTWVIAVVIGSATAAFASLVVVEVYRSIRYHHVHVADRKREADTVERAMKVQRRKARKSSTASATVRSGLRRFTLAFQRVDSGSRRRKSRLEEDQLERSESGQRSETTPQMSVPVSPAGSSAPSASANRRKSSRQSILQYIGIGNVSSASKRLGVSVTLNSKSTLVTGRAGSALDARLVSDRSDSCVVHKRDTAPEPAVTAGQGSEASTLTAPHQPEFKFPSLQSVPFIARQTLSGSPAANLNDGAELEARVPVKKPTTEHRGHRLPIGTTGGTGTAGDLSSQSLKVLFQKPRTRAPAGHRHGHAVSRHPQVGRPQVVQQQSELSTEFRPGIVNQPEYRGDI